MNIKIEHKIVGYDIVESPATEAAAATNASGDSVAQQRAETFAANAHATSNVVPMIEEFSRPQILNGYTYKIKTPVSEHAFYITINDMVLNPGTPYEKHRPVEMFINSKNMNHYQWITALTRIISSVLRKAGDITFLIEDLQSIFDPKGGYFRKGGKYMPSLVAEIGDTLEAHMKRVGLITTPSLDKHQQEMITLQRNKFEQHTADKTQPATGSGFPPGAVLCNKCNYQAMIVMDNCLTCLNCGDSKCS